MPCFFVLGLFFLPEIWYNEICMSISNAKRKNAMDKYKTLALNTVIFAVGSFGSKILLFFLTRLYTGNIISDNLNTKEMLEITANFLIPVFTFSIAEAVIRYGIDRSLGGW